SLRRMVMTNVLGSLPAKWLILLLWLICGQAALAQSGSESMDQAPIAPQLEDLKEAALTLNRELLILEEELLYPASSQVAVYVSMEVGQFFALDAVRLEIKVHHPWRHKRMLDIFLRSMRCAWKLMGSWSPVSSM